jgi:hypothetical protein
VNRPQQEATRKLELAQQEWLAAYGWKRRTDGRWVHEAARKVDGYAHGYTMRDALELTRAEPLRYGGPQ